MTYSEKFRELNCEVNSKVSPLQCIKMCYNMQADMARSIFDVKKNTLEGKIGKFLPRVNYYLNLMDWIKNLVSNEVGLKKFIDEKYLD